MTQEELPEGLSAIRDLLSRHLKAGEIEAVIRRPSPAYGGKSILEMVREGREDEVLHELRRSFDWTSTK